MGPDVNYGRCSNGSATGGCGWTANRCCLSFCSVCCVAHHAKLEHHVVPASAHYTGYMAGRNSIIAEQRAKEANKATVTAPYSPAPYTPYVAPPKIPVLGTMTPEDADEFSTVTDGSTKYAASSLRWELLDNPSAPPRPVFPTTIVNAEDTYGY